MDKQDSSVSNKNFLTSIYQIQPLEVEGLDLNKPPQTTLELIKLVSEEYEESWIYESLNWETGFTTFSYFRYG